MYHHWRVEMTITGVPAITEAELEQVNARIMGVIRHDSKADKLTLIWRFTSGSPEIWDAMSSVSTACSEILDLIETAYDPRCTDVRVHQVEGQ